MFSDNLWDVTTFINVNEMNACQRKRANPDGKDFETFFDHVLNLDIKQQAEEGEWIKDRPYDANYLQGAIELLTRVGDDPKFYFSGRKIGASAWRAIHSPPEIREKAIELHERLVKMIRLVLYENEPVVF